MTEQVSITLTNDISYVSGTVNGEVAEFSLASPGIWTAIVPKASDGKYTIEITAYNNLGTPTAYSTVIYKLNDLADLKTDWTADDYYNAEDLNKVEANIQYISEYLSSIGYVIPLEIIKIDRNNTSIDFISSINRLERNLELMANKINTVKPPGYKPYKVWNNKLGFSFLDANRYALNLKLLYQWAVYIKESFKYCGEFYCGEDVI